MKTMCLLLFLGIGVAQAQDKPQPKPQSQPTSRTGEQIYNSSCATCHATGVANAPKLHDQAAWQIRYNSALVQVKKQNPGMPVKNQDPAVFDYLVGVVKHGLNAMPPKGMCNDCSDAEYKAAIQFMMSKQK